MKNYHCSNVQKVLTWDSVDPTVHLQLLRHSHRELLLVLVQVVVEDGEGDIEVPEEKEIKCKKPASGRVRLKYCIYK